LYFIDKQFYGFIVNVRIDLDFPFPECTSMHFLYFEQETYTVPT